jgi:hypothetical protein
LLELNTVTISLSNSRFSGATASHVFFIRNTADVSRPETIANVEL